MSDLVIRPATKTDLPGIVAMLADDSLGASREMPSDMAPYYAAFERIWADANQHLMVAEAGGALVGTMQLFVLHGLASHGSTRVQIESVRVASAVRGSGLGTAMMHWAINFARTLGARQVQLTSHGSRADAHRFYERLGFLHSHHGYKMALS
jgi:GNAT superfamily N-acetyltransferase